jgi:hypothetical protein
MKDGKDILLAINIVPKTTIQLQDLHVPTYAPPSDELLLRAHAALHRLLPSQDCETCHAVMVVAHYYEFWKPAKVKVILLAESHIFTDEYDSRSFQVSTNILRPCDYNGPREYASVHLCLGYGEADAVIGVDGDATAPRAAVKGTPAYWLLLAACSSHPNNYRAGAAQLLHNKRPGPLGLRERLLYKLQILQDLKDRGIWLVDACFLGWYIPQESDYYITWSSKLVHVVTQPRPPKNLYKPTFVLAWELYTKHVLRQAAVDGKSLQLVIPIGKNMESAVTKSRIQKAVTIPGISCRVCDAFPQPNAWLKGGFASSRTEIARLVHEVAPPTNSSNNQYNYF